ncbi:MAG: nucleoside triphosphate pyrophosphohydrolase [Bacteroidales bacterium]|nr:nucleoside triphosphate pyrophosphohydrolase [Bacteroidales bacterium]
MDNNIDTNSQQPIANSQSSTQSFQRLLDIMDRLRKECPWDKKQTIESLRHLTIEEVFELSQAIVDEDYQDVKKELGDIIMHIVFYSRIAEDRNLFTIDDVINGICEKLIIRHPHVFGDTSVKSAEEVADNWEKIKLTKEHNRSVLGGVPNALPELVKAYRMQEKAAGVGFDWENKEQVWEKVEEEIRELKEEVGVWEQGKGSCNKERVTEEFGDLMFALVNYSRFIKVNPMDALEVANKKFRKRFNYIEDKAREMGKSLVDMSLDEMNELWNVSKIK